MNRIGKSLACRLVGSLVACLALAGGVAQAQSKFGPDARVFTDNLDYFRKAPAIDYWTLSQFYTSQRTPRGSSAAAAAMAVNALRGVPAGADDLILGPADLLQQVANQTWIGEVAVDGSDVSFSEYLTYLKDTMVATGLSGVTIVATQPKDAEQVTLDNFRSALSVNEASGKDVMLVYFDRGVVTGATSRPHFSPVGAYDAANDLVLILDVDRSYYVPYWVQATTLLVAMFNQFPSGPQKGNSGGYFVVTKP